MNQSTQQHPWNIGVSRSRFSFQQYRRKCIWLYLIGPEYNYKPQQIGVFEMDNPHRVYRSTLGNACRYELWGTITMAMGHLWIHGNYLEAYMVPSNCPYLELQLMSYLRVPIFPFAVTIDWVILYLSDILPLRGAPFTDPILPLVPLSMPWSIEKRMGISDYPAAMPSHPIPNS